jgi:hypothetical protein
VHGQARDRGIEIGRESLGEPIDHLVEVAAVGLGVLAGDATWRTRRP